MQEIISASEARRLGLVRYFTGKPCKYGHVAERYTRSGLCAECSRLYCSAAQRRADPEKIARRNQRQRDAYQANREAKRAYWRQWRWNNLEKATEHSRRSRLKRPGYSAQWARDNPAAIAKSLKKSKAKRAEWQRDWRQRNRAKCQAYSLNYLARLKNAVGFFSQGDIDTILENQQYRCAAPHCQKDILRSFHIDHILPLSRGGSNWPDNLQGLCKACNLQKKDKTMEEWLDRVRRIGEAT